MQNQQSEKSKQTLSVGKQAQPQEPLTDPVLRQLNTIDQRDKEYHRVQHEDFMNYIFGNTNGVRNFDGPDKKTVAALGLILMELREITKLLTFK